ncbi:hypothetical protein GWN42_24120 [candidate division KSB1 bacterium]|nr:hypothetical protein [candidate division KSB1 bacterium]
MMELNFTNQDGENFEQKIMQIKDQLNELNKELFDKFNDTNGGKNSINLTNNSLAADKDQILKLICQSEGLFQNVLWLQNTLHRAMLIRFADPIKDTSPKSIVMGPDPPPEDPPDDTIM